MGKIVFIMGKSATGKDTIYKKISEDMQDALKQIIPYTTRPIRSGEVEGVDYHYVEEATFQKLLEDNKIIEHRGYNTVHGLWRYFTVNDMVMNVDKYDYITVGTLEAYESVRNYFGKEYVLPIMVVVEAGERMQRALTREKQQAQPKFEELCRRYLADNKDYSDEKIQELEITDFFENADLDTCVKAIKEYIKEKLN